jgi:bacterioferritin-associated ferredoxin
VTVDELRSAIRRGFTDIEELKRITGTGTGPCQGKQCLHILRRLLSDETGAPMHETPLTTLRPPLEPIPFGQLAYRETPDEES